MPGRLWLWILLALALLLVAGMALQALNLLLWQLSAWLPGWLVGPLLLLLLGLLSSFPSQIPITQWRSGTAPTNSRSRPSLVVPVLPQTPPLTQAAVPVPLLTTPRSSSCRVRAVAGSIALRPAPSPIGAFDDRREPFGQARSGPAAVQASASVRPRIVVGACQRPPSATAP